MIIPALVAGTGGILATGALVWARLRKPKEEKFCNFRCPGCGQKVRYLTSKAGRAAMCPRCRQRWTLPSDPQTAWGADGLIDGYRPRVGRRQVSPYLALSSTTSDVPGWLRSERASA